MGGKIDFEQALKRLEEITSKLEKGNLSLEDSLKIFEEGINLSKFCESKLIEVENKIKILNSQEIKNTMKEEEQDEEDYEDYDDEDYEDEDDEDYDEEEFEGKKGKNLKKIENKDNKEKCSKKKMNEKEGLLPF